MVKFYQLSMDLPLMSSAKHLSMMENLSSTMSSLIASCKPIHYKILQLALILHVVTTLPLNLTQVLGISVLASTFTPPIVQTAIQTATYQLVLPIRTSSVGSVDVVISCVQVFSTSSSLTGTVLSSELLVQSFQIKTTLLQLAKTVTSLVL